MGFKILHVIDYEQTFLRSKRFVIFRKRSKKCLNIGHYNQVLIRAFYRRTTSTTLNSELPDFVGRIVGEKMTFKFKKGTVSKTLTIKSFSLDEARYCFLAFFSSPSSF